MHSLIILELNPEELQFYLIPDKVLAESSAAGHLRYCNGVVVNLEDDPEKEAVFMDFIYPLFESEWEDYSMDRSEVFESISAVYNFTFLLQF